MALDNNYYDKEFKKVKSDIRRMRKGDGRALKIGEKRLSELGKQLAIDKLIIAINDARILKEFVERPRYVPEFRKSIRFDLWTDSLIYGRRAVA